MGYSISIKVRNRELGQKMVDFAETNIKSLDRPDLEVGLVWSDQLGYCKRKNHIGFNYSAGFDREWKYTLLRWMAMKVGDTDRKTNQYRILYDGCEWILIDPSIYNKYGICIKEINWHNTPTPEVEEFQKNFMEKYSLVKYNGDFIEIDVLNKMKEMMVHYDELWEKLYVSLNPV